MTINNERITTARAYEHRKYTLAYEQNSYSMGRTRMVDAVADLVELNIFGSYLDVSCGRGEMLVHAKTLGFRPVFGTEIVPALIGRSPQIEYAEVHALPHGDKSVDVVTMFDVVEHLLVGDDELACKELARVARRHILLTANNKTSQLAIGEELHINRRGYSEWHALFTEWFPGQVTWLTSSSERKRYDHSVTWRVDL